LRHLLAVLLLPWSPKHKAIGFEGASWGLVVWMEKEERPEVRDEISKRFVEC